MEVKLLRSHLLGQTQAHLAHLLCHVAAESGAERENNLSLTWVFRLFLSPLKAPALTVQAGAMQRPCPALAAQ